MRKKIVIRIDAKLMQIQTWHCRWNVIINDDGWDFINICFNDIDVIPIYVNIIYYDLFI